MPYIFRENLFRFSLLTSDIQYPIIRDFIWMSIGFRPNSAYSIYVGVLLRSFAMFLKNWLCTVSIKFDDWKPQVSQPYNRIGSTVLSNNSSWRPKGIWRLFIRLYKRCSAFFAWSTLCLIALKKVRCFVKTVPMYLNSSQMSIVSSPNLNSKLFVFRKPNIRTFDLLRLMFSFQSLEYSKKTLIFSWNDFGSVPNITVSSAYKSVKSLRYTSKSFLAYSGWFLNN